MVWRYQSIVLLRHLRTGRIFSESTLDRRIAMAPPARRYRVLMLVNANLMSGTSSMTFDWIVVVISALLTCAHVI